MNLKFKVGDIIVTRKDCSNYRWVFKAIKTPEYILDDLDYTTEYPAEYDYIMECLEAPEGMEYEEGKIMNMNVDGAHAHYEVLPMNTGDDD